MHKQHTSTPSPTTNHLSKSTTMSYMLDLLTTPLPPSLFKPPYIKLAIQGRDISTSIPPNTPLALLTHLAPKLRRWTLPPPLPQPNPPLHPSLP